MVSCCPGFPDGGGYGNLYYQTSADIALNCLPDFHLCFFLDACPARRSCENFSWGRGVARGCGRASCRVEFGQTAFNTILALGFWYFTKDFGESYAFNRPVYDIISERLPRTLAIGVPAIAIAAIFGVCFGILSAVKRGKWLDQVLTVISTLGLGTPSFWLGIFCIYVFALELKWFPVQGFTSPSKDFAKYVYMAILPVFCMSFQLQASVARQTRSNMLEVVNQDYIRTARANGLSEARIIFRHALKNALIPVVTIIGLQVRIAIGGSLIVENVFNIPGIGNMLTTGVINRDYVLVQTGVLIVSLFTVGCNLLVDILYGFIDPRIRESWG